MYGKENDSGVSPVIGVILMVAVTVALVALVTVIVFDIGGDVSESPDATVQLEQVADDSVEATVLRNENVEEFQIQVDGTQEDTLESVGESAELTGVTDNVVVVAELPDGSSEVLSSTSIE